jgi:hypothetical protein
MALNYVTLTVDVYDGSGNYPTSGTATFTPTAVLTDGTNHEYIAQVPIVVSFKASGVPTVKLLATDNSAPLPAGWAWTVAFAGFTGAPASWNFFLPYTGGANQNLADLAPVATATTMAAYALLANTTDWLNVVTGYGAKADGRDLTAIAITATQTTLTCAGGAFTSADVGKVAYVYGAGTAGADLATTISSVTNSTTVVLAAAASTTVSSGNAFVATDDTTAWQNALAALPANGGTVYLPAGKSYVTSTLSAGVSGTVIRGGGWGSQIRYNGAVVSPCIKATTASSRLFLSDLRISQVNSTPSGTTVDASNFASSAMERVLIDAGGGSGTPPVIGIDLNGTNCHYNAIRDCRIGYSGTGSWGIAIRGTSHSNTVDNCKLIPGTAADSGSSGVYITNAHSTTLIHPDVENSPGNGIFLDTTAHGTTITNPYLEANNINLKITSGVIAPTVTGGTIESGTTANIQDNGAVSPYIVNAWPNSGSTVTRSLAGILDATATDIVAAGTQAAGAVGLAADAGHTHPAAGHRIPADLSLIAWAYDPVLCSNNTITVNGTLYLIKVILRSAQTITNLMVALDTAANTATANQNFLLLYDSGGTLRGQTAAGAIDTATQSSGLLSHAMASTYAAAAGAYWVGAYFNASTPPKLARGTGEGGTIYDPGLAAASFFWAVNGTGLTTTPPSSITPSSNTHTGAITAWAAVS